jgi:4-alpha-glucanotransferase
MMQQRQAGICIPLFSIRSRRSWGIGEIGDIPEIGKWMRAAGQSVLQILPLNELAPGESSPYSALSAMAIDPQFISMWMLSPEAGIEEFDRDAVEAIRRTPRIDYQRVRDVKMRALRACFDRFHRDEWLRDSIHAHTLRSYVAREAWWLHDYSLYRAIRASEEERPWMEWPESLRDRHDEALRVCAGELSREMLFRQYLQWIAQDQWQAARQATEGVEILGDFPFMVTRDSADVWSRPQDFLLDAQVGTPPDAFSETGQEWGLPPYNWEILQEKNFDWLRMRARRMRELYDGFRIDHLVGFYRTYVRPFDGHPPYFSPADVPQQLSLGETLVGLMMETGADVSAEDLGTVPDFVRQSITRLGVPGYKVLRWEPESPPTYPPRSVAMTGTHDTDALAVWWESLDAKQQRRFGIESPVFTSAIRDFLLQLMFNAGSDLMLLPLQDAFGWRDRINLPASISDANWTYVLPWPVDRMLVEPEAVDCAERLMQWGHLTGRSAGSLRP